MELGNMCFGNSRGEFETPAFTYEPLITLLYMTDADYKNDTFELRSYYWGDCDCGWDDYCGEPKAEHRKDCFSVEARKLEDLFKNEKIMTAKLRELYEKHKIEYDRKNPRWGYLAVCSCGYPERAQTEFLHKLDTFKGGVEALGGHKPTCSIIVPNFIHFKSGLSVKWYKHIGRDSYCNREISEKEFFSIFKDCVNSIKEYK